MVTATVYVTSNWEEVMLWPCSHCTSCFLNEQSARKHEAQREQDPIGCWSHVCGCGDMSADKDKFRDHIRHEHSRTGEDHITKVDESNPWFRCKCETAYSEVVDFIDHCWDCPRVPTNGGRHDRDPTKEVACFVCGQPYTKRGISTHMNTHQLDRKSGTRGIVATPKPGQQTTINARPRLPLLQPNGDPYTNPVPKTWAP